MDFARRDKKKSLASRCRHYMDYQSKTELPDGEGGFTEQWTNIQGATSIPSEILPIGAERRAEMRSWNIIATHYIRSRSRIPIQEVGRAVLSNVGGSRYFYIKTLEDIQTRGVELFMVAEERRV